MTAARRRVRLAAAVGLVALAVLGYSAYKITGRVSGDALGTVHKTPAPQQKATTAPPSTRASRVTVSPSPTNASPTATVAPRIQTIAPVSAVAFGPNGTADGDDPQDAGRVLTDPAVGWVTQWYATPNFGALKQGTGVLLDMGRTVTITTVSLTLGSPPGAVVQLRVGTAPELGALRTVTSGTATSGQLSLRPTAPASGRYVLVWFTTLPPDGAGTYQVTLHHVSVQGRP